MTSRNRFPEDSDFEVKNKKTFPKISKRLFHLINPLIQKNNVSITLQEDLSVKDSFLGDNLEVDLVVLISSWNFKLMVTLVTGVGIFPDVAINLNFQGAVFFFERS